MCVGVLLWYLLHSAIDFTLLWRSLANVRAVASDVDDNNLIDALMKLVRFILLCV